MGNSRPSYHLISAAAGGVACEHFLAKSKQVWRFALVILLIANNVASIPYGIPVLEIENMKKFAAYMKDNWALKGPLVWEDGKTYVLPQDYADMHGWEEMVAKVAMLYHGLSPSEKAQCGIWGGSYAHAGAINYYAKKYQLPEAHSFVGSYLLWVPDTLVFDRQILVDDTWLTESSFFNNMVFTDSIENPYAREKGYIYFRSEPKGDIISAGAKLVHDRKADMLH